MPTFLFRRILATINPKPLGFSHLCNLRFTSSLRFSGLRLVLLPHRIPVPWSIFMLFIHWFWPRGFCLNRAATHHCWPRLPTSRGDSRTSPGHRSSSGFHEPSPL